MVGEPVLRLVEPEVGDLREDFALSGDAVGHNAVEGRNPVGGHEEERISQVEDFTHLPRFHLGDSGKVEGKDGIRRHGENVVPEWGRPKRNMEGRLRLTRGLGEAVQRVYLQGSRRRLYFRGRASTL